MQERKIHNYTLRGLCVIVLGIALLLTGGANAVVSSIVVNPSGEILHQRNAKLVRYPASLTKLMTIYLAFEAIRDKKISFYDQIVVSKKASSMPPSKIWLRPQDTISVRDAIMSLIVKSANDSAVALAEHIGRTEYGFAEMMNKRAINLGMSKTSFENASGWHHRNQKTTAYDMAKLAIAIHRDFPEYYHMFSRKEFRYGTACFRCKNYVFNNLDGAEGLKTGYTSKAGFNIVTSVQRNGVRLIGVVMGGKTNKQRDAEMMRLMNSQFAVLGRSQH